MASTSLQPRSTTCAPRRAFLLSAACGLLTAWLAAPAWAQGLINFSVTSGSTNAHYQVGDDGMNLRPFPVPQTNGGRSWATTRSDYPGGRWHLYGQYDGTTPTGSTNTTVMAWSEESGPKAVTDIHGPLYGTGGARLWSNDGLDSFVSFLLYDPVAHKSYTCRAHVSADDIASPDFQAVTLGDPRLEIVKEWQGTSTTTVALSFSWSHDGSRFYYYDPRDRTRIRAKTVGVGVSIDDDPVVFVAPAELTELNVIPPVDPLNPVSDRYLVATGVFSSTRRGLEWGVLAMDLATGAWQWLATPNSTGLSLSQIRGPAFSPDGSTIAFGAVRSVTTTKPKKTTYYAGVYRVPFFGGLVTRVTEVSTASSSYAAVNAWNLP